MMFLVWALLGAHAHARRIGSFSGDFGVAWLSRSGAATLLISQVAGQFPRIAFVDLSRLCVQETHRVEERRGIKYEHGYSSWRHMALFAAARRILKGRFAWRPCATHDLLGHEARGRAPGSSRRGYALVGARVDSLPHGGLAAVSEVSALWDAGSGLIEPAAELVSSARAACVICWSSSLSLLRAGETRASCRADLESGIPLGDESVDIVTTASSIEHLSAAGQLRFMSEGATAIVAFGRGHG